MLQPPGDLLLEVLDLAVDRDRVVRGREELLDLLLALRALELLIHLAEDRLADGRPLCDLQELLKLPFRDGRLRPPHLPMEVRRLAGAHPLKLQELLLAAPLDQVDLLHRGAELHRVELLELLCHRHSSAWTCGSC